MEESLAVINHSEDLAINRAPDVVLEEARKAAKALTDVLSKKKKKVMFGGRQYLEFEDWQTVGRFYGLSAQVVSTSFVAYDDAKGFEARAIVTRTDGIVVSAAESLCMNDEKTWGNKPLFQLKSMAQTRACAKALRNVLAWVVVLAGYAPTPSEEMSDTNHVDNSPTYDDNDNIAWPNSRVSNPEGRVTPDPMAELRKLMMDPAFTDKDRKDFIEWSKKKHRQEVLELTVQKKKDVIAMVNRERQPGEDLEGEQVTP